MGRAIRRSATRPPAACGRRRPGRRGRRCSPPRCMAPAGCSAARKRGDALRRRRWRRGCMSAPSPCEAATSTRARWPIAACRRCSRGTRAASVSCIPFGRSPWSWRGRMLWILSGTDARCRRFWGGASPFSRSGGRVRTGGDAQPAPDDRGRGAGRNRRLGYVDSVPAAAASRAPRVRAHGRFRSSLALQTRILP